jgi:hypothetical protein
MAQEVGWEDKRRRHSVALRCAGGAAVEKPALLNFNMSNANPVSIISARVSDTEQHLWTSGLENVMVFQQTDGQRDLKVRLGAGTA